MNNEPNNYLSQEAPRWMRDMFQGRLKNQSFMPC
jgi:hypothetical protein